jgi:hypothetical protein
MNKYLIIVFLMAQGFANDTTNSGQIGDDLLNDFVKDVTSDMSNPDAYEE